MYDLKCKRQDCEYNKNWNCSLKKLEIKQDTSCDRYRKTEKDIENEEKINQPAIRKNIKVECGANCLFNKDSNCEANGITVQTNNNISCPNCCTFMPK